MTALAYNAAGGHGCISVVSNVAPRLCAELQERSLDGDFAGALQVQDRLVPLHDAIFLEPGLAGAKCGLALLGRGNEEIRLPMLPVSEPTKGVIRKAMIHAGLLNA
jgi:4-hydroxy-tetrahydrodipicolinate synthase